MHVASKFKSLDTDLHSLTTWYQVDPFLQLVDDSKLQAVKSGPDQLSKVYGSKEDDEDAVRSLSALEKADIQSQESFATMIVKTLAKSSDVNIITEHMSHIFFVIRIVMLTI